MFFTPFAFVQQPFAVSVIPSTLTGYYIGGVFTSYATATQPYFRMLDSSGSISSSFNVGAGIDGAVFSLATDADGKLVLGGSFATYSGSTSNRIVRVNPDGTKDTGFNPGAGANSINTLAIQSDQKIVIGGNFTTYSGSGASYIARINTNGTIDTGSSWNTGAGFNGTLYSVVIQSDQKIIAGGNPTTYSGSTKNYIARLNTDGTADTGSSWNQGVGFGNAVYAIALQSDQKILVGGSFTSYSGSTSPRLIRLNTNGTKDTTFNPGSGGPNSNVYALAVQPDGKILVGGIFTAYSGSTQFYLTRTNTDGTRDTTFNIGAGFDSSGVYGIHVQSDGKILVQGTFSNYSGSVANGVIRLDNSGSIDTTFNRSLSINTSTILNRSMLQLSNGSIALGGNYTGNRVGYLTTSNTSGSTNAQSVINSYGLNGSIITGLTLSNGSVLLGGNNFYYSGSNIGYLLRLNSDGTRATGSLWNQGAGFNSNINTIVTQSDGKIVIGGAFSTYSGSTKNRIVRLNTDGTSDTGSSWNQGAGFGNTVTTLAIQSDQKIVAGGSFTTYSGSGATRIARINTNGTIDTGSSWNTGAGFNVNPMSIDIQSDQKIVAGGGFTTYSGSTKNYIVRLNTDGTADTGSSWNQGTGFNFQGGNNIDKVLIQSDQKILVGGNFTSYSGSSSPRIIRINTNGTKDTTFNPGSGGPNGGVRAITVEPGTGKILLGGDFTTYSGSTANRIVRVNSNGTIDSTFVPTGSGFNSTVNMILPY